MRIANALGALASIVGFCWTPLCAAVSAALTVAQATVYYFMGRTRKAGALMVGAGMSLLGERFFNNYIGRHLTGNATVMRLVQIFARNAGSTGWSQP